MPENKRPLHTTGRVATRMSEAERAALQSRLAPHTPGAAWLANPPTNLEVELGIGNGLALLERARANPDFQFLGCELYLNGLRTLVSALEKTPQPNVHLYNGDARTLLEALPEGSLTRLLVLFPDPWPKSSHHKRRLIQPEFLSEVARVLKKGGELWVVTDWPSYAYHTIGHVFGHKSFRLAQTGAAADCKPSARLEEQLGPHHLGQAPAWWQSTKYQQKAEVAGRKSWYIKAVRV